MDYSPDLVSGCIYLGSLYQDGLGVKQDYLKAADLYKNTCDIGFVAGYYSLAMMYEDGLGISRDYKL